MNWKELLLSEIETAYKSTEVLLEKVGDSELSWKPSPQNNWMTMGQLLMHITGACGAACKGFATGDWGLPEGMDISNLKPEEMLPPADQLPTVESVADTKRLLAEDKRIAKDIVNQIDENDLANKKIAAPWDPREVVLGQRFLQMIEHLTSHKCQLFYYLKLQGKPVNTGDLWAG